MGGGNGDRLKGGYGLIVLDHDEVYRTLTMAEAIAAVEEALCAAALGLAVAPVRSSVAMGGGAVLLTMPAAVRPTRAVKTVETDRPMPGVRCRSAPPALAVKLVTVFSENERRSLPTVQGAIVLFDPTDGRPRAILDGRAITAIRTGALTGVALRHLSAPSAKTALMIGAGGQAYDQARALIECLTLRKLYLYNRAMRKALALKERLEQDVLKGRPVAQFGHEALTIEVLTALDERVREADVIVTATSAPEPFIDESMVRQGQTIVAIGAFRPEMSELRPEVIARADRLFVDTSSGAREEAGDLLKAEGHGWRWERLTGELSEVVAGRLIGRESETELIVFKSVGVGYLDAAVADRAVGRLGAR